MEKLTLMQLREILEEEQRVDARRIAERFETALPFVTALLETLAMLGYAEADAEATRGPGGCDRCPLAKGCTKKPRALPYYWRAAAPKFGSER